MFHSIGFIPRSKTFVGTWTELTLVLIGSSKNSGIGVRIMVFGVMLAGGIPAKSMSSDKGGGAVSPGSNISFAL